LGTARQYSKTESIADELVNFDIVPQTGTTGASACGLTAPYGSSAMAMAMGLQLRQSKVNSKQISNWVLICNYL